MQSVQAPVFIGPVHEKLQPALPQPGINVDQLRNAQTNRSLKGRDYLLCHRTQGCLAAGIGNLRQYRVGRQNPQR